MQRKAAHPLGDKLPAHLIGIFNEPALLKGENSALYWDMVSAIIDEQQPHTFLDWICIRDLASSLWEEDIFRRATHAIISGGQRLAVQQFLAEIAPGEEGVERLNKIKDTPAHRAARFFSARKNDSEEICSQLTKYGIGEAELFARSAQNNNDAILMFEGMVTRRERGRRKLQKEMSRRGSSQEVKSEAYAGANAHSQRPRGSCQEVETPESMGFEAHHRGQSAASREVAATTSEEVRDEDQRNVERLGSCQEVTAKMVGSHHHGH
ncbi:hypothetical protein I6F33_32505 [Bradyrhizobium sp. BRP20]|uniref:hypothetical protein n=1 Tax=Bradyrhizobium sp. BRP20 TaxID=2793822 RepID=UPI001CD245DA|nr:hypothetical protein [Bradyrhizobium sp. BRP20]MCA1437650.1 hypothetical protein [Bradyrhizobium sp. BRP20]